MINISEANKAKWNNSADHKVLTIIFPDDNVTITNNDIVSESLNLEESINEDNVLTFTGCIASRFSFEVADIIQDLRGHRLTASISIGGEAAIPIFYGYVDTQDNLSHQDVVTKFEAYDPLVSRINEVDVTSWYNGLSFPRTVRNFRDAFFTYLGISQRTVSLPNDGLQMTGKTIDDEVITGGQIVKYICQLNGVFGQFDREGYFTYRKLTPITKALYPAVDLYPSPDIFPSRENANEDASSIYSAIRYEPFEVDKISKVNIVNSSGAIQGTYGSGTNAFTIADNPLAWAVNMTTAAQNIYNAVSEVWFVPSEIGAVGLPYLECGDIVFINTMKNIVRSYVLSRSLTGIQAIADAYRCPSAKKQPVYKETQSTQISRNVDHIETNSEHIEENRVHFFHLDADYIETGTLSANRIAANSIAVEKLTGKINGNGGTGSNNWEIDLTNGTMTIGTIDATKITTGSLSADRIAAHSLSVGKISGDIGNGDWGINFNNGTMRIGTLDASAINAGTLSAERIAANSIAVAKLTGTISNGTWQIDLTNGTMTIGELDAGKITTGTLSAQRISAKSLSVNKLIPPTGGAASWTSIQYVKSISVNNTAKTITQEGGRIDILAGNTEFRWSSTVSY